MKEIVISKENSNQRIDKFVRKYLNDAPLSFIYKTFRKKDVKVNGHWQDPSYILQPEDVVRIYVTDEQIKDFNKPRNIEDIKFNLDIIYEDKNVLIVNKPKGILVYGDINEKRITLTNKVQAYLYSKKEFLNDGTSFNPSPVHRLDRNTSGIMVFAKNFLTCQSFYELLKKKEEIEKHYLVLVLGDTPSSGKINLPLYKDMSSGMVNVVPIANGGKESLTEYVKIGGNGTYSLLKVNLITGRTHQIRAHFKAIGFPVLGDGKYGDFKENRYFKDRFKYDSQFLHAYTIQFKNMEGDLSYLSNKEFIAPLPKEEASILKALNIKY